MLQKIIEKSSDRCLEIIKYLIKKNSYVPLLNISMIENSTDENFEIIKYLLHMTNFSIDQETFMRISRDSCGINCKIINFCLENKCSVDNLNPPFYTFDCIKVIQIFLDHKADINEESHYEKLSSLSYALKYREKKTIEFIIKNGFELHINLAKNKIHLAPIMIELYNNIRFIFFPIFKLMLSKNFNVNTQINKKTLFYEIMRYFYYMIDDMNKNIIFESLDILLNNGADLYSSISKKNIVKNDIHHIKMTIIECITKYYKNNEITDFVLNNKK
jgi:ankyrin repeat protein